MNNLATSREEFSGWACGLSATSVTVEELHGDLPVELDVPRREGFPYCDGMPVRVLHMHDSEGGEVIEIEPIS